MKGPRWGLRPYWTAPGVSGGPIYVEQYTDKAKRTNFVEVGLWCKDVVVDASLAGTLLGVNSSQTGGISLILVLHTAS